MKQRVSLITLGVSDLERARAFAAGATRSPTTPTGRSPRTAAFGSTKPFRKTGRPTRIRAFPVASGADFTN